MEGSGAGMVALTDRRSIVDQRGNQRELELWGNINGSEPLVILGHLLGNWPNHLYLLNIYFD